MKSLSAAPTPRSDTIDRLKRPAPEDVAQRLRGRAPLVFSEAALSWPACATWTAERLVAACGHHRVRIEHYPTGDRAGMWTYRDQTIAEYFALLADAAEQRRYYLAEKPTREVFPELLSELRFSELLPPGTRTIKEVVFAGKDTFSAPHFHRGTHALVVQLVGAKRVSLVSPLLTRQLSLHPWYSPRNNFTLGGSEQQPIAQAVPSIEVRLEPGDALFIPVHWWHWVVGEGLSVSTTAFWKAPFRDWNFPAPGLRDLVAGQIRQLQLAVGKASLRLGLVRPLAFAAEKLGIVDDRRLLEDFLRNQ